MEKNKMMQVLVPAIAAAAVVVLIGVLVAMSDWGGAKPTGKGGKKSGVSTEQVNDEGMVDDLPSLEDPAWKTRPDGMRVWDVKEGEGDECPKGAVVTIHYTGWLLDGSSFDGSRKKGAPAEFPLADLVAGWQEGIPGMKPGGIRRLKIPYQMAYGERGRPGIPPRSNLVFEIKLLAWK